MISIIFGADPCVPQEIPCILGAYRCVLQMTTIMFGTFLKYRWRRSLRFTYFQMISNIFGAGPYALQVISFDFGLDPYVLQVISIIFKADPCVLQVVSFIFAFYK